MIYKSDYSKVQLISLVILRLLIGWHLLYEGIAKLLIPNWSSTSFLQESKWILSGFSDWIISNPTILNIVDLLNIWGLIAIGLGLIFGLFSKTAALVGSLLLFLYYLITPPLIGFEYSQPLDGNYLIVNKTLIEAFALIVLAIFPTSHIIGLDMFFRKKKSKL